jgi:hypothetical protein
MLRRVSHVVEALVAPRCSASAPSMTGAATQSLVTSVRTLRNLHHYKHARHKSLVKERRKYSRNWYLNAGNNYELSETVAHEREAFENFGEYRFDSNNDRHILTTSSLRDLPAKERLSALMNTVLKDRWKVRDKDRGFDKTKMLLEVLECFSEMKQLGTYTCFDDMPDEEQDMFLQQVTSCATFARRCSHSHPDAVAVLIRAAEICDELGCGDKRDEMLNLAEQSALVMGRALHHERESEPLKLLEGDALAINTSALREKNAEAIQKRYPTLSLNAQKPERFPWYGKFAKDGDVFHPVKGYLRYELGAPHRQLRD